MNTLRYLFAALAFGAITVWGSENLFWFAPPVDLTLPGWLMTWAAYSLCAGAVLSIALWTGISDWRGLYLAGVLFGYLIEGVVVDTIYADFPVQLVWTAMAWHGLFTVLVLVGALRLAPRWSPLHHAALLAGIAAFSAVFALFWPFERADLPGLAMVAHYVAGAAVLVPLAHVALDRMGRLIRPAPITLWTLPVLAGLIWSAKTGVAFDPVRLAFPLVVGATIWAMWRLGDRAPLELGRRAPVLRHVAFVIAPLVAVLVVVPLWQGGVRFPGHWAIFLLTVPLSFGLWLWCLWAAFTRPAALPSA